MSWFFLLVAGLMEVGWVVAMKYAEGWTRLWPSVASIAMMVASVYFLALALKTIPLGTGYAIWTGIGAVGTAAVGILVFAESASPARLACIGLIVAGILGLKLTASS